MEIERNNYNEQAEINRHAERMYKEVKEKGYGYFYSGQFPSRDIAVKAAKVLVNKGYYAKIVCFVERWKGYQGIAVSNKPLEETSARMVYSQMIN